MRWTPGGRSSDLEDRRGSSGRFGGGGMRIGLGGALVLLVLSLVFKQDFFALLGGGAGGEPTAAAPVASTPEEEKKVEFVSFVLDDAQSTWERLFQARGQTYEHAKLVLFRDAIQSACGFAEAATGPFYCPGDAKVYIDLGFYDDLRQRFGAPGDFAQAYVVAHEVGHHIQTLTGLSDQVASARQQGGRGASNALSVRQELQADCYAGVWGHHAARDNLLEPGDAEEGLRAAAAIGDDRLQQQSEGRVAPESFTHGSSDQRMTWLRRGLDSGRIDACDTFQR
jgi:uncharacterized protein